MEFNINPVAFSVFGIDVRWYGIIMAIAILIATYLSDKRAKNYGFYKDVIVDLFLVTLPSAVIGARLYYVVFEWKQYVDEPLQIFNYRAGGLAIHGGLIFGFLAGFLFCKQKKLNPWKLADVVAPTIALAQSIGRWGNFINQEAHGGVTNLPWGIIIDGVKVHPTFLYESIWDLSIFLIIILFFEKHKKFDGELVLLYGIFYSIGRFFIEGLRTDSLMIGPFRMAQVISFVIIFVSSFIYYYLLKNNEK